MGDIKMKKNKTIAYMLAAALLVGGTFVGTKALFTDKIETAGELQISTGDVNIEIIEPSKWALIRNGNELKEGTKSSLVVWVAVNTHASVKSTIVSSWVSHQEIN